MRRLGVGLWIALATGLLGWLEPPAAIGRGLAPAGDPQAAAPLLLSALVAVVAWLALGWLAVAWLLEAASAVPGAAGRLARRASAAVTPAFLARCLRGSLAVGTGIGTAVGSVGVADGALAATPTTGVCAPMQATATAGGWAGTELPNLDRPVDGCPASTPWRPSGPAAVPLATAPVPTSVPLAGAPVPAPGHLAHRVQPGDTLWAIAVSELGTQATSEAVAARWPQWWEANRIEIGSDPNLLLPGQVLRPPERAAPPPSATSPPPAPR